MFYIDILRDFLALLSDMPNTPVDNQLIKNCTATSDKNSLAALLLNQMTTHLSY
ncbi:hypothetical protein JCM18902_1786 [Psychrobacter sp. JCM 18902]|nr:hypothetical protein JCM18902_1786 [Psychrobacter sp. JCM 18902]